ncbi:ventricular zone-expressed PH domain-containing protein isoform X2 [Paramormyrops kingsleyae]|uniref:Ventricular zone expressed PH domain-containing 1 n=2 Tax=Paramormyrops kingsleyae TaxID=1676925 RepID=A0A3B3QVI7_9TELE|nr:ventricular zone-expressed PH domain-containing protein homolog 1 isoform X2 [Paramormyrops kingsleyae]XP_023648419.1 ventricular zone-expressed PH domain-containing protein homolog 1 isoform X2 [Paramormyrops kingsleyae]
MHQLFGLVLSQRNLSRAGDLFSLEDAEIEDSLSQALEEIKAISCSPDYLTNDNDQAVVEICITRITTAIRETRSIERHGAALVSLWESCLEHNQQPQGKDEDTPHAKIASDITSCILQNYDRPPVMALAVPVAVRFLQGGNRELSRNMSSYLSLAAISKAELLAEHTEAIVRAVLGGNHMLLRVLPSVYRKQPEAIHQHTDGLAAMMSQLAQPEQQHLLRLMLMVAKQQPLALRSTVASLVTHLSDPLLNDGLLTVLVGVSQASPASLASHLTTLRVAGQRFPNLLGHIVKIHGAVGLTDEALARSSLQYLVSLLGSMEHSVHHTLLQEIHGLTSCFSSIQGSEASEDVFRMSRNFTAIAHLLDHQLDLQCPQPSGEDDEAEEFPKPFDLGSEASRRDPEERPQIKIQAFEEKLDEEGELKAESSGPQRRNSTGQTARDERREMRFNRSRSLALQAVRSRSINLDNGQDEAAVEKGVEGTPAERSASPVHQERTVTLQAHIPAASTLQDPGSGGEGQATGSDTQDRDRDQLWLHMKDNAERIRAFCADASRHIPSPDQCVIEDSLHGCLARLSFSCPLKGSYCLYAKSSFSLCSFQPRLWLQLMLLFLQSKAKEPLASGDEAVCLLDALWEKTQLTGAQSFEKTVTQATFPHKKDLESLESQLKEVRFFDLFGYSESAGDWLCFMCNNPEKAAVVNREGQPLIEGKLKEKQVRWKFIKRWKTRYFTLAGNQLLFGKGKSKDDPEDGPIELSKVQSVKAVVRKRRDCGLPRAFEIFTESRTYVLKARDERRTEEWLQCINVAMAQVREHQHQEATTYL